MTLAPIHVPTHPLASQLTLSARLRYELGDPDSTLRATADRSGPAVLVHAGGEVDAHNEHTWRRLLNETAALVVPPSSLVVDVTGLDFLGCCAFAALVDEAKRCHLRDVELRLVSCQPIVSRIVALCGLSEMLPLYPTVDFALGADMTECLW